MRIRVLFRMRRQVERRARPVSRYGAGLHLGEWPRDGFCVEQEECECGVRKVEELVGVEIMDTWSWVSEEGCALPFEGWGGGKLTVPAI